MNGQHVGQSPLYPDNGHLKPLIYIFKHFTSEIMFWHIYTWNIYGNFDRKHERSLQPHKVLMEWKPGVDLMGHFVVLKK